jgi:hypothetical protein
VVDVRALGGWTCVALALGIAACATTPSADAGRDAAPRDAGTDADLHDASYDTSPLDTGACPTSPTFDDVSAAVLVPSCALPGCHSEAAPDPGGDLRFGVPNARERLVLVSSIYGGGRTLVIPYDVARSFLWQKITDDLPPDGLAGAPMPLAAPGHWVELPPDQLELVRCWIASGAL